MPVIITFGNQKGGVGKTTTTINVADAIARLGYRVLVIDADPQGNSSSILLENIKLREKYSLVKALEAGHNNVRLTSMACKTSNDHLHVIPNTIQCMIWERRAATNPDAVFGFLKLMQNDREIEKYDFVLIDTPPNVGAMVNNALMISDYVVIPIPISDQFALDGLTTFLKILQHVRKRNQELKLLGVVLTKYDGTVSVYKKNREDRKSVV